MKIQNRFNLVSGAVIAAAVMIPVIGCSDNPLEAACCKDFKVGADMAAVDFGLSGELKGKYYAFAQSAADFSAASDGLLKDVTTSCMNIALDLGASADDPKVQGKTGAAAVTAWCDLASAQINGLFAAGGALAAAGTVKIDFQPPQCQVNVQAQANCQASCSVDAKCDIKANPPTCKGGALTVDCKGQCDVTVEEPSISCQGSCSASCSGECQATGGVDVNCEGRCEGTCKGSAQGGTGSGLQADGTCKGTCSGKCTMSADAKVTCNGSCNGKCTGSCKATPGSASAKCSGKCNAEFTPLTCEGGKLEGGCKVDANCQGQCNASASAKASCTPPALSITASGAAALTGEAFAKYQIAIDTLQTNLPALLVSAKVRGRVLVDLTAGLTASATASLPAFTGSAKAAVCSTVIVGAVADGVASATAAFQGSVKVVGSAKL